MILQTIIGLFAFFPYAISANSRMELSVSASLLGRCGARSNSSHCTMFCDPIWANDTCVLEERSKDAKAKASVYLATSTENNIIPAKRLSNGGYDYGHVLNLTFLFYEAQRVGKLPKDNPIGWRGDAFINDKSPTGTDITGGWLDAGDNVRFNFPMSWSAGTIAWSLVLFPESYKTTHTYNVAYNNLKWVSDYFMKCYYHTDSIVAQIGNGNIDHARWTRPEYIKDANPVYTLSPSKPGSDLAGSVAGFLALMSNIASQQNDKQYALLMMEYAKKYYTFGNKYKGLYSSHIPDAAAFYPSSSFYDDLAWGALCIFSSTKESYYLTQAKQHMQDHWSKEGVPWKNYDWDSQSWGAKVLLAKYAPDVTRARLEVDSFVLTWLKSNNDGHDGPKFTPKGLAWYSPWGSLRHSSNAVFLILAHAKLNHQDKVARQSMLCFAHKQIRYILGESGRSFVVGYGHNPPMKPHHRSSSCPRMPAVCDWTWFTKTTQNPSILYGALVGGPNLEDKYIDDRVDYVSNEVTTDYNAGFSSALSGLVQEVWNKNICK